MKVSLNKTVRSLTAMAFLLALFLNIVPSLNQSNDTTLIEKVLAQETTDDERDYVVDCILDWENGEPVIGEINYCKSGTSDCTPFDCRKKEENPE